LFLHQVFGNVLVFLLLNLLYLLFLLLFELAPVILLALPL
jgi:hypothetical protein